MAEQDSHGPAPSVVHGPPLAAEIGDRPQTIPGFLREVTARFASHEALVMHGAAGAVRWSYADLWDRSVAIARALAAGGTGRDSRVGILMSNRPEFLSSLFGVALAGGVAVPLSTFAAEAELEHLLRISAVHTLLFEPGVAKRDLAASLLALEPAIAESPAGGLVSRRFPHLQRLVAAVPGGSAGAGGIESLEDFLGRGDAVPEEIVAQRADQTAPADTAVLFFSSGSTGLPKGILHNQRAVAVQWWRWPRNLGLSGDLRVWTANGLFWSGNFSMAVGSALATGGSLVLQPTFDPAEALELIQRERVNAPFAMPHQWGRIAAEPGFSAADLSGLRFIDLPFAGLEHPTLETDYRTPHAFGCTETLTINTQVPVGTSDRPRDEGNGLPLAGNSLKIVDPMTGAVLPRGEKGEIAVKGPTLMDRYLGRNREECFDDEGYFHTGDGGYVDATGWLFWEGRLTDIIKTGGANVSPVEVDEQIQTFPGVRATQTVGVPDDALGEMVVSCIVPHAGAEIVEQALQAFLKQRLASYKVPRRILILREDELPLIGSGTKIRTAEIRELAARRLGAGERPAGEAGHS